MDEGKPSTGKQGIPDTWVIYKPCEPLYEMLHTCVILGKIRDMADPDEGGAPEEEPGSETEEVTLKIPGP